MARMFQPTDGVMIDDSIGTIKMALARRWTGIPPDVLITQATFIVNRMIDEEGSKPQVELLWNGEPAGSLPAEWLKIDGMMVF